jgi:hypothetical protein
MPEFEAAGFLVVPDVIAAIIDVIAPVCDVRVFADRNIASKYIISLSIRLSTDDHGTCPVVDVFTVKMTLEDRRVFDITLYKRSEIAVSRKTIWE